MVPRKQSTSLRVTFGALVATMGVMAIALSLFTGNVYRDQIIKQEQAALARLLSSKISIWLDEFVERVSSVGLNLQSEEEFRELVSRQRIEPLQRHIDSRFNQYLIAADRVKIEEIDLFDARLASITRSTVGLSDPQVKAPLCAALVQQAKQRNGSERMKLMSRRCFDRGKALQAVLVPVGGFSPFGYVQVVADLSASLREIERELGLPLSIQLPDGTTSYRSDRWPLTQEYHDYFTSAYNLVTDDVSPILSLQVAQDLSMLNPELQRLRLFVLCAAVVAMVFVALFTFLILRRTVLRPIDRLSTQLQKVRENERLLGETIAEDGASEIRQLITGFNTMSTELNRLYNTLSASHRELENEVRVRRRMEKAMARSRDAAIESSRLKSEFLANVSHEIRTPMSGILGMLELLDDTKLAPAQYDYVDMARRSGETLLNIINDILDFSKFEAGRLQLEELEIDLSRTVKMVMELFADQAIAKNISLACELREDLPSTVIGDPTRLQQILINLLGNAIKFTEKGTVTLKVTSLSQDDSSVVLCFAVQDTGIGIAKEKEKSIFESFIQADGSTTRKYGGTGLGLAIVQQLANLMGGEVGVKSKPDQGSTFWFTAKFARAPIAPLCFVHRHTRQPLRVLIADADTHDHGGLEQCLTAWGIQHDQVNSSDVVLQVIDEARKHGRAYDVLFLSTQLHEYIKIARVLNKVPEADRLGVVALKPVSAHGFDERWREAGIFSYVTKPLHQDQLYDCITAVLGEPFSLPTKSPVHAKRGAGDDPQFRILVAEDNIVNQKVVVGLLNRFGYSVDIAENGQKAIDLWREHAYDVILMDCQMPILDGYRASKEIRRLEVLQSAKLRVPIIALTAHSMSVTWESCRKAGMDAYLSKPIKPATLKAALKRWLPKRGAAGEITDDDPRKSENIVEA